MSTALIWKMSRSNDAIRLDYHFENTTAQVVYVNDGIIVALQGGGHLRAKNVRTETTADPELARISIAPPSGDVPSAVVPPSFFVAVAPGASFDGWRDLKLPLRRWDAMGTEVMLPKTIKKIAFALEVFDGEPPTWGEVKAKDGSPIRFPEGYTPRMVEGGTQPIP